MLIYTALHCRYIKPFASDAKGDTFGDWKAGEPGKRTSYAHTRTNTHGQGQKQYPAHDITSAQVSYQKFWPVDGSIYQKWAHLKSLNPACQQQCISPSFFQF